MGLQDGTLPTIPGLYACFGCHNRSPFASSEEARARWAKPLFSFSVTRVACGDTSVQGDQPSGSDGGGHPIQGRACEPPQLLPSWSWPGKPSPGWTPPVPLPQLQLRFRPCLLEVSTGGTSNPPRPEPSSAFVTEVRPSSVVSIRQTRLQAESWASPWPPGPLPLPRPPTLRPWAQPASPSPPPPPRVLTRFTWRCQPPWLPRRLPTSLFPSPPGPFSTQQPVDIIHHQVAVAALGPELAMAAELTSSCDASGSLGLSAPLQGAGSCPVP